MKKFNLKNETILSDKELFSELIDGAVATIERGMPVMRMTEEMLFTPNHLGSFIESHMSFNESLYGGNEYFESFLDDYYCNQLKGNDYEILTKKTLKHQKPKLASSLREQLKITNNIVLVSDGLQIALVNMQNVLALPHKNKIDKNFEFNVLVRSDMEFSIAYIHLSIIESELGISSNLYQIEGETHSPKKLFRSQYIGSQSRHYEDILLIGSLLKKVA